MEARLAAWRAKKRKEAMVCRIKEVLSWQRSPTGSTVDDKDDLESIISEDSIDFSTPPRDSTFFTWTMCCLYFLLWATLYIIAIETEFGAAYFVISALIFIYFNTRSGPKRKGEVSAYSVFNPNCQSIDGTLKPEQFEQEIRFGATSVH
ncbi:SAYSvFN domain-containing protein 1 [Copidosoma floridanum]|uniref:SAYSvFN domain-containing protein 1 n=1 Tax=Copidosoma floridanum TaxID=29053 RepID=UPI0006C99231|nr:SAYSvFN domain-containing protein 1 [Copidosoma floridanum]